MYDIEAAAETLEAKGAGPLADSVRELEATYIRISRELEALRARVASCTCGAARATENAG